MATSGPNGPCLGWYNGTRTDDGLGWASLERTIFCMRDWGLNDLSLDRRACHRTTSARWSPGSLGLDPVADPPPQSFNCASEDLCATTALTEARVRYRLTGTSRGGLDQVTTQGGARLRSEPALRRRLRPRHQLHASRSARSADPGGRRRWAAWASRGSASENRPFRIFVSDVEQRCGNGVGGARRGMRRQGSARELVRGPRLGIGDLACGRNCHYDRSDCSPPGCEGGPGRAELRVRAGGERTRLRHRRRRLLPRRAGKLRRRRPGHRAHVPRLVRGPAVCVFKKFAGDLVPVCQLCPARGGNGQAGYGCPCDRDSDCAPTGQAGPTSLDFSGPTRARSDASAAAPSKAGGQGPGVCLPKMDPSGNDITSASLYGNNAVEEFERTRWLCKANCNSLEQRTNLDYACMYDQNPATRLLQRRLCRHRRLRRSPARPVRGDGHALRPTLEPEQCVEECSPNETARSATNLLREVGLPARLHVHAELGEPAALRAVSVRRQSLDDRPRSVVVRTVRQWWRMRFPWTRAKRGPSRMTTYVVRWLRPSTPTNVLDGARRD